MAEKAPAAPTLAEVEKESAHDTIMAVMAEKAAEPRAAADTPAVEKPAASTATATKETATEADKAQRERDELGRFKAKAGEEAAAEAPDKVAEPAGDTGAAPAETVATEAEPIEPPIEWKAAEQDQFRTLPRPAQEFLLAQYNAAQDEKTKASQSAGKYAVIDQMLAPRRDALARDGLDDVGYLQYLDRLSQSAARDAPGFIKWFAAQRGVNLAQLIGQAQPQPGQQPQPGVGGDPYIAQLEQRFGRIEGALEQEQRRIQEQHQAALANEITSFASAVDDKGKPQHPYFQELKGLMGSLMRGGQSPDLKSAYDMACRAHPEVSRKIASAAQARAEQDRQADARKKAEAARKAGSSISGSPGDRSAPPPSGDIREDLRQQLAARGMISS